MPITPNEGLTAVSHPIGRDRESSSLVGQAAALQHRQPPRCRAAVISIMGGVHYDGLSGYKSYDLAWLGPIVYPLTFAVIAQAVVFYDMSCCRGKKRLDWLVPRSARQETGAAAPPDARITLLVLIVMASEATFAILCLVQCAINFTARSFPGGGGACDFQAFYATYYTFSSIGTFALAMVFGARAIITNGGCPLFKVPMIALSGVAVHGGAPLIA